MRSVAKMRPLLAAMTMGCWLAACGSDSGTTPSTQNNAGGDAGSDAASLADGGTAGDSADAKASDGAAVGQADGGSTDAGKDAGKDATKDTSKPVPEDDKIDGATELVFDDNGVASNQDVLEPTGDIDHYQFIGKKGQLVQILLATAQQQTPYDPDTLDTVITIWGPDKKQIAMNDDPASGGNNDSSMIFLVPADGTYYIAVQECHTFLGANPGYSGSCADPADKTNTDYEILVVDLDPAKNPNIVSETEANDEAAKANTIGYAKGQNGYLQSVVTGGLGSDKDVDVFKFTVPADSNVAEGRATARFDLQRGGKEGNGSTLDAVVVWVASEATPTVALAKVDMTDGSLDVPVTLGQSYYLYVQHGPNAKAGAADFYILTHGVGGSNPLEKNEAANDTLAGADAMGSGQTASGGKGFFIGGDIIAGGKDVDYFFADVPTSNAGVVSLACSSMWSGSGVMGFTATLQGADGSNLSGGSKVEDSQGLFLQKVTVPAGTTKLLLRLSATGQDPAVTGTHYQCGMVFAAK